MADDQIQQLETRIETLERELADLRKGQDGLSRDARIARYHRRWSCQRITMKSNVTFTTPVLLLGEGSITIGANVKFGWHGDPGFFDGSILIDARNSAHIEIGDDVVVNNNCAIIAEGAGIAIGARSLIAWSVEISDSDFHDLHPARRLDGDGLTRKVTLGQNTLIGATAILKGSTIGDDAVIGYGSLVAGAIPPGVVAAGRPARVVRSLS